MTINKLTDERIASLINGCEGWLNFVYRDYADIAAALRELQEYRKAAAEPVGEFYHEKAGWYQISEGDRVPDNRRIPLYAAPPAPVVLDDLFAAMEEVLRISDRDHEAWHRAKAEIESCRTAVPEALSGESQEYRKAESADRTMLKRLAVILSGSDSSGEIGALTVTAQSFVDRCKQLAGELHQLQTARLIVPAVTQSVVQHSPELLPCPVSLMRKFLGTDWKPVTERERVRREHAGWSRLTFGEVGPVGPLKHLAKEALEAADAPGDLHEWADMQFLLWDAQRAAGITDEQITRAMIEKLAINKNRKWPEPKDGEPRQHIAEGVDRDTER